MANKSRKVSFYRLSLVKETFIAERNNIQLRTLSNCEIEEHFKKIYDEKMLTLANNYKAIDVASNSNYVIEVISYDFHRAFLKIGQQNSANTVALRDRTTLESENVPMRESQLLELFTFCLIDFETGIVSYIGINGAPRISAIRSLFNKYLLQEENTHATLAAIMTDDILETLVRKHIISKLSITVSVPNDEVLSGAIGLDAENFDSLRNVKTRTATYKLVGRRNKNIFESSSKLAELIASIKSKFGDNLKGLSANAKDLNEKSQTYDLLQYNFTKTVTIGEEDATLLSLNDFKTAVENTYNTYKEELVRYSRI